MEQVLSALGLLSDRMQDMEKALAPAQKIARLLEAGEKEDYGEGDGNGHGRGSYYGDIDGAQSRTIELALNTPKNRLAEFTETPGSMVLPMAIDEALDQWIASMDKWRAEAEGRNEEPNPDDMPMLGVVFRQCFDIRMRSKGRKLLYEAIAMSQIQKETRAAMGSETGAF